MAKIIEIKLSYDNGAWKINNSSINPISIQIGDMILFRSGDGKEYTVIIDGINPYFTTDSENSYVFIVNPFNLTITDPAVSVTTAPHIPTKVYVRIGNKSILCDAPPRIIITPAV